MGLDTEHRVRRNSTSKGGQRSGMKSYKRNRWLNIEMNRKKVLFVSEAVLCNLVIQSVSHSPTSFYKHFKKSISVYLAGRRCFWKEP